MGGGRGQRCATSQTRSCHAPGWFLRASNRPRVTDHEAIVRSSAAFTLHSVCEVSPPETNVVPRGECSRDVRRNFPRHSDCVIIQPNGCTSSVVGRVSRQLFGALADATRRDILARVMDADASVSELAARYRDVVCSRTEARGRAGTCPAGDQAEGWPRAARGRQPRRRAPCQSPAGAVRAALAGARRSPGRAVGHFIPRRSECRSSRFARTPKR